VNSDHLTLLGLVAMFLAGVSYWAAQWNRYVLFGVVVALVLNWLGDSLDGTLARVRDRQRPRYGFYVDHVVDVFGAAFLLIGLALSPYMSSMVALVLLLVYLMLSAEIYLATHTVGTFKISYWIFGGTELRLLLATGTVYALYRPEVTLAGESYLLFDVAGVIAIASLVVTLVVSVIRNTRTLYLAEPLTK
jgi:phosphatidylglycerophosphate synthase